MRTVGAASLLALILAMLGPPPAAAADPPPACPAIQAPPLILPHLRDAVTHNKEVIIVAIGSSSTEGWRASDIAHSYPALLQRMLNQGLPGSHFAVINRGIGGQDVSEELPRLGADALAVRPTVIIWQVGANGAMQHASPDLFKRLLTGGLRRLVAANVDVVLMDNQRAPRILAAAEHTELERAMQDVAQETGVAVFARGNLMDRWRDAGHPYGTYLSDDGVHHNDLGYQCVTRALADALLAGIDKAPLPADPKPN